MRNFLTGLLVLVFCVGLVQAQDYQVSSIGELESALGSASEGEVIGMAGGTYAIDDSLSLPNGVTIEGGYTSDFDDRDVEANETIIDGGENTNLITANGTTEWVLDGLTLTGGYADYAPTNVTVRDDGTVAADRVSGSALRLTNGATGTISNVRVTDNNISSVQTVYEEGGTQYFVDNRGSAIYLRGSSSLTIQNSEVSENYDVSREYETATGTVEERRCQAVIYAATSGEGSLQIINSQIQDNPTADQSVMDVFETVGEADAWGDPGGPVEGLDADTLGGSLIWMAGGNRLTISGTTIRNNLVLGILVNHVTGNVFVMNESSVLEQNYGHDGGLLLHASFTLLNDVTIQDNVTSESALLQTPEPGATAQIAEVDNVQVLRNRVTHSRFMMLEFFERGLFVNSVVRDNYVAPRGDRILEMRSVGAGPAEVAGLAIFSNNIVENNYDPRRPGLEFTANRTEISNNIIRGNSTAQSTIQIEDPMAELYMYNNVITDNYTFRSDEESWVLELKDAEGDVHVFNNTFYNNESAHMDIVGFQNENLTTVGFKNNLFYSNVADSAEGFLFGSLDFQEDFVEISNNMVGDWQDNIAGWDPHEPPFIAPGENGNIDLADGDPMFVNVLDSERGAGPGGEVYKHNLSLQEGSPAIDAGVDPSGFYETPYPEHVTDTLYADPTLDKAGRSREDGAWDIGAYEGSHETVDIEDAPSPVAAYRLAQSYPNPFNPTTKISYTLPEESTVRLTVYNTLGQQVATLVNDKKQNSGTFTVQFNGSQLPSGVYYYRLQAGEFTKTKKMLLIK